MRYTQRPFHISKNLLIHLYSTMTQQTIAKLLEVDPGTIRRQLLIHDIPISPKYKEKGRNKIYIEKEILQDLYINKSMSLREIYAYLGHTPDLITRELRRHNIPLRKVGYHNGFVQGKHHAYKKLSSFYEKKLEKIRLFCEDEDNKVGFHSETWGELMLLIDEEM